MYSFLVAVLVSMIPFYILRKKYSSNSPLQFINWFYIRGIATE